MWDDVLIMDRNEHVVFVSFESESELIRSREWLSVYCVFLQCFEFASSLTLKSSRGRYIYCSRLIRPLKRWRKGSKVKGFILNFHYLHDICVTVLSHAL